MLELVNTGNITKYKGKTLSEVILDDLITAATDVNIEPIDDDVDEVELDDINFLNVEHDTFVLHFDYHNAFIHLIVFIH